VAELRERRDGGVGGREREARDERGGDEAGQQQEGVQEERLVRVRVRVRVGIRVGIRVRVRVRVRVGIRVRVRVQEARLARGARRAQAAEEGARDHGRPG